MQEKETKIWGDAEKRREKQGPISNTSFSLKCGPITREILGYQIVYRSLYSLAFSKEWA